MRSKPRERCSVIENQSIGKDVDSVGNIDAWLCLRFVLGLSLVGDFFGSGLRKKIKDLGFFFFLVLWTGGGGGDGGCLCCVGCGLLCLAPNKL